jgi:exosome complex component RRP43
MGIPDAAQDLSTEMEVDAFRRIFPLRFFERHLSESLRPDGRQLGKARDTIVNLGLVSTADGSALAKIGSTVRTRLSRFDSIHMISNVLLT